MKMVSKLQANIPSPNTGEQKSELIDLIGKNPLGEVLDDKTSFFLDVFPENSGNLFFFRGNLYIYI